MFLRSCVWAAELYVLCTSTALRHAPAQDGQCKAGHYKLVQFTAAIVNRFVDSRPGPLTEGVQAERRCAAERRYCGYARVTRAVCVHCIRMSTYMPLTPKNNRCAKPADVQRSGTFQPASGAHILELATCDGRHPFPLRPPFQFTTAHICALALLTGQGLPLEPPSVHWHLQRWRAT